MMVVQVKEPREKVGEMRVASAKTLPAKHLPLWTEGIGEELGEELGEGLGMVLNWSDQLSWPNSI